MNALDVPGDGIPSEAQDTDRPVPAPRRAVWAAFDPAWYRRTYHADEGLSDAALHAAYLDGGGAAGRSPNPFFDEGWYRARYPDQAALAAEGAVASGFDAYASGAWLTHSPHWLFSERDYRIKYPDLVSAPRADGGKYVNGYDHFLSHLTDVFQPALRFFDAAFYLRGFSDAEQAEVLRIGPYRHFLAENHAGRREHRTSIYFDPDWYRQTYPHVAEEIARGLWHSALHHYLANPAPLHYDPLPWFSEADYGRRYPDVVGAVHGGLYRNCYDHYVSAGVSEQRQPLEGLALTPSGRRESDVDLQDPEIDNPFRQYLLARLDAAEAAARGEEASDEAAAKALFRRRARDSLSLYGRNPIDFTCAGPPELSVVMVGHNQVALTLQTLASLRADFAGDIELIFVDSGSTDDTRFIGRALRGAAIIRSEVNVGYVEACNAGFARVTAPATLLLNNDVRLGFRAVANAVRRLHADPANGAVGGKVLRTNGVLQEAGCILWRDGDAHGYMRGGEPDAPEANFVRAVDFCSAAFLLVRSDVLQRIGGYDPMFSPAYYEDVDLCLRIRAEGYRIVYDPAVQIEHLEYGTSSAVVGAEAAMRRSRTRFVAKHMRTLRHHHARNDMTLVAARARGAPKGRILFIEDKIPLRRMGSGYVRSNDIIRAMAGLGYEVTVFPVMKLAYPPLSLFADFPDTVELMHRSSVEDLAGFLDARPNHYDLGWIARTHNLDRLIPLLDAKAHIAPTNRLILDTEALACVRLRQRAALAGETPATSLAEDVAEELRHAYYCQCVVAASEGESALIRAAGFTDVHTLGHARAVSLTRRDWAERTGLLFVGALHDREAPNYDSLVWLVDQVLPHLDRLLLPDVRVTVAGYRAPRLDLGAIVHHPRIVIRNAEDDLAPLYDAHRVFVAPTRLAAGLPYKVHEAASFGLPAVVTDVLRDQLGWTEGEDLLAAPHTDPALFARKLAELHEDEALWRAVRGNAARRIRAENSPDGYVTALAGILSASDTPLALGHGGGPVAGLLTGPAGRSGA
jgi:GT2 family glycosyltransferase